MDAWRLPTALPRGTHGPSPSAAGTGRGPAGPRAHRRPPPPGCPADCGSQSACTYLSPTCPVVWGGEGVPLAALGHERSQSPLSCANSGLVLPLSWPRMCRATLPCDLRKVNFCVVKGLEASVCRSLTVTSPRHRRWGRGKKMSSETLGRQDRVGTRSGSVRRAGTQQTAGLRCEEGVRTDNVLAVATSPVPALCAGLIRRPPGPSVPGEAVGVCGFGWLTAGALGRCSSQELASTTDP